MEARWMETLALGSQAGRPCHFAWSGGVRWLQGLLKHGGRSGEVGGDAEEARVLVGGDGEGDVARGGGGGDGLGF